MKTQSYLPNMQLLKKLHGALIQTLLRYALDTATRNNARDLCLATFHKTRFNSHINFLRNCLRQKVIPVGFRRKTASNSFLNNIADHVSQTYSIRLMRQTLRDLSHKWELYDPKKSAAKELFTFYTDQLTVSSIVHHIHLLNSKLFVKLEDTKQRKFASLIKKTYFHNKSRTTVFKISETLELSSEETKVLEKGLSFIPTLTHIDETSTKLDLISLAEFVYMPTSTILMKL